MRLIYHDDTKKLTYEQVYKRCQEGYGIKEPDRISGFMGFLYKISDVYAFGKLEKWIELDDRLEPELKQFIERFYAEDYGFVTRSEQDNNLENRWISGSCCWTIARYTFDDKELANAYGGIVLEFFMDYGLIYSIEENMREIYANVYGDPEYRHQIDYKA